MNQNSAATGAGRSSDLRDTSRSTSGSLIASDRVEGTKVLDRAGKEIGSIKSLKIDKVSGHVAYAIAEFGGFFGIGGHEYAIPWQTLDYDPDKRGFSTNLTKEQLEGSPSSGRRSSENVYRASAGGVGTGRRPDTESDTVASSSAIDSDLYDEDNDENWDRGRDRELYDYYAVGYYWEE